MSIANARRRSGKRPPAWPAVQLERLEDRLLLSSAPTAQLSAEAVTAPGLASHAVSVTYWDDQAVDVSTIGSGDLLVTGPNRFAAPAALVAVDNGTNGTPRVATYRIDAPNGQWAFADNGFYAVWLAGGAVADTEGNAVEQTRLGTFEVRVSDSLGPTAELVWLGLPQRGARQLTFYVGYFDEMAVDLTTIGDGDIRVAGPGGFEQSASFVQIMPPDWWMTATPLQGQVLKPQAVYAAYVIDAPGGLWDPTDNGQYSFFLCADEVADTVGNFAATTELTPLVAQIPTADLAGTLQKLTLAATGVPGDKGQALIRLTNAGSLPARGNVTVRVYAETTIGEQTVRIVIGSVVVRIDLKPLGSRTVPVKLLIPPDAAPGTYVLGGEVNPDGMIEEHPTANNDVVISRTLDVVWRFGTVGARRNVTMTLLDAQGTLVSFSLRGSGYGQVLQGPDGWTLLFGQTTLGSQAAITTPRGKRTSVAGITIDKLGGLKAPTTDLAGDVTIVGGLSRLALGDVSGGRKIIIAGSTPLRAEFDRVADLIIDSQAPIASITATEWLDTDLLTDRIKAPQLFRLAIKGDGRRRLTGDFAADLELAGIPGTSVTVQNVRIAGSLTAASWSVFGSMGPLTVGRWIDGTDLRCRGDIRSVTVGGIRNTTIFAGVRNDLAGLPTLASDFDILASIRGFTVRGMGGQSFIASNVAAALLAGVNVKAVAVDNAGVAFGLAGRVVKGRIYAPRPGPGDDFDVRAQSGDVLVSIR